MDYSELTKVYEELEATTSKLEKAEIISNFLGRIPRDLLSIVPLLVMGEVFPEWSPLELGIGPSLLYDSISFVSGKNKKEIENMLREEGDVGLATERIFEKKIQTSLSYRKLSIKDVYQTFEKISTISGSRSQDKKIKLIADLLSNASPQESKYITRTILGELRVGVAEGLVRDAIAKAFDCPVKTVERAFMLTNDFGKVAITAAENGEKGLEGLSMKVGVPLKPMLAQITPSLEEGLEDAGRAGVEIKYDGARVQIHKHGKDVQIFSRRLEDVTKPLPDIVKYTLEAVKAEDVILDGEAVAIDPKTNKPRPFQDILRRFRRKYDVKKSAEKIPFVVYLFDILFLDGKTTIDLSFEERRIKLEETVKPIPDKFELAKQLVSTDTGKIEKFYQKSLEMGHEGVMIKNLDATYIPAARVGHMYKIKPVMETLDLVITGALWGTGKRVGWLSSYLLSCRDETTGEFKPLGRVGTGVTEEQLDEFTKLLKPLIEYESGSEVTIKPEMVVEIAYQEIQKSSKYESGYALRFPRVIRLRDDKSPDEADTIESVSKLYETQALK
ncbi:MAG: ATP-dependent DNA ligase [Candidatus Hydrothermarchaeales archaeon]